MRRARAQLTSTCVLANAVSHSNQSLFKALSGQHTAASRVLIEPRGSHIICQKAQNSVGSNNLNVLLLIARIEPTACLQAVLQYFDLSITHRFLGASCPFSGHRAQMLRKTVIKLHTHEATTNRKSPVIGHVDEAIACRVQIQLMQEHCASKED